MVLNIDDHSSELHIFYSDSHDSQHWTKHESNPIFINSTFERNACFIGHENNLYRVSQSQGFSEYGESLQIHMIKNLTPSCSEEQKTESRKQKAESIFAR